MELGYWNFRGIATPIRLALEYAGVEYVERRFPDKAAWLAHRDGSLAATGAMPFPSLPYLLVDDKTGVSQSRVIVRFLADRYGFAGEGEAERTAAAMVQEEAADLFNGFRKWAFGPTGPAGDALKAEVVGGVVATHAGRLEAFLADKQWVAGGETPTYADLILYDSVEQLWAMDDDLKGRYPKLTALHARVGALPRVAAYVARTDGDNPYITRPFTPGRL
ncbi:hypothetical protein I4F81_011417 [Pyropia yezoensis]|uniref:Uncharacterized protein n=1 Tax=Pyropia yezoensis TaxID=2788 RepID=A0ACC3CFF0_PYRYE|nr:hypothetical protein I4F81_011417 [Neopyropia yezoensis]